MHEVTVIKLLLYKCKVCILLLLATCGMSQ